MISEKDFKHVENNVIKWGKTRYINWERSRIKMERMIKNPEPVDFPRIYQIEISNKCNLKCIMCPHTKMTRPKRNMTLGEFDLVIKNGIWFPQMIELQCFGESTLNPDIGIMIDKLQGVGCRASLSTNGTLLHDKELCKKLMGLDTLVLSIDGATKETYEKVRNYSWEKTLHALDTFFEVKSLVPNNMYVVIQLIGMNETRHEEANYNEFFSRYGADEIRIKYILDSMAGSVNLNEVPVPEGDRKPCLEAYSGLVVQADGNIGPCGRDYNGISNFGNIFYQSIEDIWHSKAYKDFRHAHENPELLVNYPLCSGCREWDLINLRLEDFITCPQFKGADIRIKDIYKEEEF